MNLNYKPFFEGQSDNEKNIESHRDNQIELTIGIFS